MNFITLIKYCFECLSGRWETEIYSPKELLAKGKVKELLPPLKNTRHFDISKYMVTLYIYLDIAYI